MTAKTRFFLKIAIRTGIFFGLAMTGIMLLLFTVALPFKAATLPILGLGLVSGVLFGLSFGGVITLMQVMGLKKIGETEFTDETLAVIQLKTIQIEQSFDAVIAKLEESVKFNKIKIVTPQKKIKITGGISLSSWGEQVEITLTQTQGNLNTFELLSKPSMRTTMADYGKNRQNVLELERILTAKDTNSKKDTDLSEHLLD